MAATVESGRRGHTVFGSLLAQLRERWMQTAFVCERVQEFLWEYAPEDFERACEPRNPLRRYLLNRR